MVSDEERREQAQSALQRLAQEERLRVYLIAIGGTGMAPLACLLAELGHQVIGSDGPLYPPMSDLLASVGIEPLVGYDAEHLKQQPIDLVVVGNAVPRHNAEVVAAEDLGLPRISMPEAVGHFLLSKRRSVVATGTHGKTTTSAMAAWVLSECGQDPGYLIGGAPIGLESSFHLGGGDHFVIEGDEYNAAYFDRGPKFLHYQAHTVTLTSVEYDHVDLYPTAVSFREAFRQLVTSLPADGVLVACIDEPELCEIASMAPCTLVAYSSSPVTGSELAAEPQSTEPSLSAEREESSAVDTMVRAAVRPLAPPQVDERGTRFALEHEGQDFEIALPMWGDHNVANAIAVWCATIRNGCDPGQVAQALSSFAGVKRRLQVIGEPNGVVVVDDFAHHPTEVAASLAALRSRYPQRRLVALFEPRSLSAGRSAFRDAYVDAFAPADVVLLAPVFHAERLGAEERLDLKDLCVRLADTGKIASSYNDYDEILQAALGGSQEGDVVVTMSSGAFGGAPQRLLEALSGA